MLNTLSRGCGLAHDWTIADIGSGTGNLARLFLDAGYCVIGVEPNREMREAGERLLADYLAFESIDGTAENIPFESGSVEMITVLKAFLGVCVRPVIYRSPAHLVMRKSLRQ